MNKYKTISEVMKNINKEKLHSVNDVGYYISEPAYTVRLWTKMYNIPVVQKSKKHNKYWRYSSIRYLLKIKRLYRDLNLTHAGVYKIMYNYNRQEWLEQQMKEYEDHGKNVRESKTILSRESRRSDTQCKKSTRTQRISKERTNDRENVSEVFKDYRNTESVE